MKLGSNALLTVLACAIAGGAACAPEPSGKAGTGGTSAATGGTGGTSSTGGTGGAATGGSGGMGTGGSIGSTGGSVGTGGASGGTAGNDAGTSASDGATSKDGASSGGAFAIIGDFDKDPATGRNCHKQSQTASGGDHSPKITWQNVPADAKSLVFSTKDRSGNVHYVLCNIPPTLNELPPDINVAMRPAGTEFGAGNGRPGWHGPGAGPPAREYEYRIWALKVDKVPAGSCKPQGKNYPASVTDNVIGNFAETTAWGTRTGACK